MANVPPCRYLAAKTFCALFFHCKQEASVIFKSRAALLSTVLDMIVHYLFVYWSQNCLSNVSRWGWRLRGLDND